MGRTENQKRRIERRLCPIGESNPCFSLERATSWAARRMGPLNPESVLVSPMCVKIASCDFDHNLTEVLTFFQQTMPFADLRQRQHMIDHWAHMPRFHQRQHTL